MRRRIWCGSRRWDFFHIRCRRHFHLHRRRRLHFRWRHWWARLPRQQRRQRLHRIIRRTKKLETTIKLSNNIKRQTTNGIRIENVTRPDETINCNNTSNKFNNNNNNSSSSNSSNKWSQKCDPNPWVWFYLKSINRMITITDDFYLVIYSKWDFEMWSYQAADNINYWLHWAGFYTVWKLLQSKFFFLAEPPRTNTGLLSQHETPITTQSENFGKPLTTSSTTSSTFGLTLTTSTATSMSTPTGISCPPPTFSTFGGNGILPNVDNTALLRPNAVALALSHSEIRLPTKPLDISEVSSCAITQPPPPIVTNVVAAANKMSSVSANLNHQPSTSCSSSTVSLLRGIR